MLLLLFCLIHHYYYCNDRLDTLHYETYTSNSVHVHMCQLISFSCPYRTAFGNWDIMSHRFHFQEFYGWQRDLKRIKKEKMSHWIKHQNFFVALFIFIIKRRVIIIIIVSVHHKITTTTTITFKYHLLLSIFPFFFSCLIPGKTLPLLTKNLSVSVLKTFLITLQTIHFNYHTLWIKFFKSMTTVENKADNSMSCTWNVSSFYARAALVMNNWILWYFIGKTITIRHVVAWMAFLGVFLMLLTGLLTWLNNRKHVK